MEKQSFVLKGNIIYSINARELAFAEHAYIACTDGVCAGVFAQLPKEYENLPVKDYGDALIIPGLVDLHTHAPQYTFRGLGMDMELLDWLNAITFPEEEKYADLAYAEKAYSQFADDLKHGATTRAVVFATIHIDSTLLLMKLLSDAGIGSMVGKVCTDRNVTPALQESVTECITSLLYGLRQTDFMHAKGELTDRTRMILTPRFVPACTQELAEELVKVAQQYGLKAQSHLCENQKEIAWVQELEPASQSYADCYRYVGMLGNPVSSVMAHCVWCSDEEIKMLKEGGTFVAHCPTSNTNLSSGIAPIRKYLDAGLKIGLGTDIAGGHSSSIFRAMADAIQVSKLYFRHVDESKSALTLEEAFYLGTLGGGEFFGKVGSFLPGYEFDAVVLSDEKLTSTRELSLRDRLERAVYLSESTKVVAKYVQGDRIL